MSRLVRPEYVRQRILGLLRDGKLISQIVSETGLPASTIHLWARRAGLRTPRAKPQPPVVAKPGRLKNGMTFLAASRLVMQRIRDGWTSPSSRDGGAD